MQPILAVWTNFYVIIGTAAAALIGLQFIAVTLIASGNRGPGSMREMNAFATPNIILFSTALFASAVMSGPWREPVHLGICLALVGCVGVFSSLRSFWHARRTKYRPDVEDWIWYISLPLAAHFSMLVLGCLLIAARDRRIAVGGRPGARVPVHRHPQYLGHRDLHRYTAT